MAKRGVKRHIKQTKGMKKAVRRTALKIKKAVNKNKKKIVIGAGIALATAAAAAGTVYAVRKYGKKGKKRR